MMEARTTIGVRPSDGASGWWLIVIGLCLALQGCSDRDDELSIATDATAGNGVMEEQSQAEQGSFAENPLALRVEAAREVAPGITVIPDGGIDFVPNVGVVEGERAGLVIDTGLGPRNGERVHELARELAGGRELILTTTHFHPEHNFGAQAFKDRAKIILNSAQARELSAKGEAWIDLFSGFGDALAQALEGTRIVRPDETYDDRLMLDLGGREVLLEKIPGHTLGDQLVYVKDEGVLFAGDMIEEKLLPIMADEDSSGSAWIQSLERIADISPRILVPGHGRVDHGDLNLLQRYLDYLRFLEGEVRALVEDGLTRTEILEELPPRIETRYADWRNHEFIAFSISVFHAEITGTAPELPDLSEL